MMPPMWHLGSFVQNKFVDCKVYHYVFEEKVRIMADNVSWVDLGWLSESRRGLSHFVSPLQMTAISFAEKGETSTGDRLPNQQDYRSPEEWLEYRANLDVIGQCHSFIDRQFSVQQHPLALLPGWLP
jgi:hypothetical protein